MLQESILQYFLPSLSYHLSLKSFFLSIFEWPLKAGFTVSIKSEVIAEICFLFVSISVKTLGKTNYFR